MPRRIPIVLCAVLAGCTVGGDAEGDNDWQTVTSEAGDTTVVRTTGVREETAARQLVREWSIGSVEGDTPYSFGQITEVVVGPENDVFVFDRQPRLLSQFDSTGKFVRSIGRRGQGPGEYEGTNGLGVHRDGKIALWDFGNRINFYTPAGEPIGSTPVPGGGRYSTNGALSVDTLGNTYIRTRVADPPPGDDMQRTGRMFGITGLVRYAPDGRIVDSLMAPDIIVDAPRLIAQSGGGTSMSSVPYSPEFIWTFSPHGYFVSGRSDVYALSLTRPDGAVTRIEMDAERVPVSAAEKTDQEESTVASMRTTDPSWRWNGAPIPDVKPYFKGLFVGNDGRIWVSLSRPSEEIPVAERAEPQVYSGIKFPVATLREPAAYDVFEGDGRYLGRVLFPWRTRWRAARGDLVWTVTRDSLDVEHITRWRVSPPLGGR